MARESDQGLSADQYQRIIAWQDELVLSLPPGLQKVVMWLYDYGAPDLEIEQIANALAPENLAQRVGIKIWWERLRDRDDESR